MEVIYSSSDQYYVFQGWQDMAGRDRRVGSGREAIESSASAVGENGGYCEKTNQERDDDFY